MLRPIGVVRGTTPGRVAGGQVRSSASEASTRRGHSGRTLGGHGLLSCFPGASSSQLLPRLRSRWKLTTVLVILTLVATACSSGGTSGRGGSGTIQKGGTVTYANTVGGYPDSILPFDNLTTSVASNINTFQYLMYRPLYLYGVSGKPTVDEALSLAYAPVFNKSHTQVTVRLKPRHWSDGEPVDAKDIVFWENLLESEKLQWGEYVPGEYPDNVKSLRIDNPSTVTFTLTAPYNPRWFWYNELPYIVPLPMAWDKTSQGAAPGSGHCTTDIHRCKAVYKFLLSQSNHLATYSTNPLWQVVDGPWRLKSFTGGGTNVVMVPNRKWQGVDKPHISEFREVAFASDAAELDSLRADDLTVGYLPLVDAPQRTPGSKVLPNEPALRANYYVQEWYNWAATAEAYLNYINPTAGPIFRQLYFRQAMQHVINQNGIVRSISRGWDVPEYGPVPQVPANPYYSPVEKANFESFNIGAAKHLLVAHGWAVHPGGVSTCQRPGTGPSDCGAGIAKGARLDFSFLFWNQNTAIFDNYQSLKSNASRVGIDLTLKSEPTLGDTFSAVGLCTPQVVHTSKCSWQLVRTGQELYLPVPTGDVYYDCGASSNHGHYCSSTMDRLIGATLHSGSATAMTQYEAYAAKQLPVLWGPIPPLRIAEIANNLRGVIGDPLITITPERWYFVKK